MSVGPVGLNAAAVSALIDAELSALANDAQALQAQLQPGDVVQAQVLPSNGLTDLVMINGNRVAASLPPTLHPGDVIQVQVTAFDGAQILLQMLDAETQASAGAAAGTPGGAPAATPTGAGAGGSGTTGDATSGDSAAVTGGSAGTAAASGAAAASSLLAGVSAPALAAARPNISPTAILTAVAVRAGESLPAPPAAPIGGAPTNVILPPPAKPSAVPFPLLSGAQPSSIEARLAAARTGLPPPNPLPAQPPPAAAAPPVTSRAMPPPPVPSPVVPTGTTIPPPAARPFVAPPQIVPASTFAPSAASAPATPVNAAAATAPVTVTTGLAVYRDPVALVRALRLPVTPTTVAAAKLAIDNPQRLPNALATLESALPNVDDPRVATLRAVSAFVSRIDPSSPELASQIASYVEHVVDSTEPKLVTAIAAQLVAERAPAPGPPAAATAPAQTGQTAQPAAQSAGAALAAAEAAATEQALPVTILADAALRATALLHDLKSALFSIIGTPPAAAGEELTGAAASALTAITGAQLSAANAMAVNPQTMAFTIPLWTGAGYTQAQLQIDRDAPDRGGTALDGDNFHIAFILETKNLGTVGVDLRTVGRAVNVSVKTQATPAAERFADALTRLTDRLTHLRYRVASSDAQVARPTGPAAAVSAPVIPADPPENVMDLRA